MVDSPNKVKRHGNKPSAPAEMSRTADEEVLCDAGDDSGLDLGTEEDYQMDDGSQCASSDLDDGNNVDHNNNSDIQDSGADSSSQADASSDIEGEPGPNDDQLGSESEAESVTINPSPLTNAVRTTRKLITVLQQLEDKERESARRDAELECARRERAQLETKLRSYSERIARRDKRIEKLAEDVDLVCNELERVESQLAKRVEELAQRDSELAQKNEELDRVREELEAQMRLVQSQQMSASGSSGSTKDGNGEDAAAELKRLRKENRKLTTQIRGQWHTIATLRTQIREAEQRYDPLYPIEKAAVILSAIYAIKLQGKPAIWKHYKLFLYQDVRPPDVEKRLGVSLNALREALIPLRDHIEIQDDRHTAAHPSRDMAHLLAWDLDRIKVRGVDTDIELHRTLVACAEAVPFCHRAGAHVKNVDAVEKEKLAPPYIYVGDSDDEENDEDGEVVVVESPVVTDTKPARENSSKLARKSSPLEEGEVAEEEGRGKRKEEQRSASVVGSEGRKKEETAERRAGPTWAVSGTKDENEAGGKTTDEVVERLASLEVKERGSNRKQRRSRMQRAAGMSPSSSEAKEGEMELSGRPLKRRRQ